MTLPLQLSLEWLLGRYCLYVVMSVFISVCLSIAFTILPIFLDTPWALFFLLEKFWKSANQPTDMGDTIRICHPLNSVTLSTHVQVRIFWRSYSDTSLEFTREIEEENWNFKTPFTHGLRHFWAKTPKSKLKFIKNCLNNMLSDSSKSAFKMASEDPQKIIAKKYKKHEIVRLL